MDQFESVLPFLRPRSAELTWHVVLLAILLCLGIATLIGLYIFRWLRRRRQIEANFFHQAEEKGLEPSQARFLLLQARKNRLNNPLLLLTSVYVFDRYLGKLASRLADRDRADPTLELIAEIRPLLGFDELPADQALRSTRQLSSGQTLMIWTQGDDPEDFSPWIVIARDERSISIAPMLRDNLQQFGSLKPGSLLTVRFWREDDTEYRFSSKILELDPGSHTVVLRHVDRLERQQQRDFFRLPVSFPILLFAIPPEEPEQPIEELLTQHENEEEEGFDSREESEEEGNFDLANGPRIGGEVVNLSAGGLSLMTEDQPPPDHRLLIDPDFDGPFPLSAIFCEVVHETPAAEGFNLQIQFVDLPPGRERELVRLVYQRQIQALHGSGTEFPPSPARTAAPETPTPADETDDPSL